MTSIGSLNTLSIKTGMGGLVSGMDIDELVKNLSATGRQKIVKEQQKVQSLEWKQSAYRTVTNALAEFQKSYLDLLSSTNFRSQSFFNTTKATASSNAVSILPTKTAMTGDLTIDYISQLATAQKISGNLPASKTLTGRIPSEASGSLSGNDIDNLLSALEGKSIGLNLDGRLRTITFDSEFVSNVNADKTAQGLEAALQQAADKAFGIAGPGERIINLSLNGDELSFGANGSQLTVQAIGGDIDTLAALGLNNGQSNRLSLYTSLVSTSLATDLDPGVESFKFTINGENFEFDKSKALTDIIREINNNGKAGVTIAYSSVSDTFSITSKVTGSGDNIVIAENEGNLMSALGLAGHNAGNTYGKNAILSVNGQEIVRSDNVFNLDGLSVELNETTGSAIKISVKEDSSVLKEPIEKFIEDYNALIDLISGLISERPDSKYPPLSEEQKAEMTEKQIEQWESKAKVGMLASDPILRKILGDMRIAMGSAGKDGGIRLTDLGITTGDYSDNGKLKIVDESKFLEGLKTKGSQIADMFSTAETGIAQRINSVIEGAVKKTGPEKERGTLIMRAGLEKTTSEKENSISKMIEDTNKRIAALQKRLMGDEQRYWAQFTAMETALSRFNVQSTMLMQFSSNGQY